MKDPAFLFYSNDFYEGTRLMLPEERACYVDLMIYQHQHGYIPDDKKRIQQYCSGVDEATLEATLKAKFKHCDKGWYNERLQVVINERQEYTNKQSDNGLVGQFFKKAKASLNAKKINELKSFIYDTYGKENLINELKKDKATYEATLDGLLKHLEDVNEDENININRDNSINTDKKTKKIKRADFVSMTDTEYQSLISKVGESGALRCIEILDNYKGANGRRYKSDYRAILNWVIDKYNEELNRQGKQVKQPVNNSSSKRKYDEQF